MKLFENLVRFVMLTTKANNMDESHGIMHSFNTLHNAYNIYRAENIKNPEIIPHERIIYISSAIHDMCDKKYMNEQIGITNIKRFLSNDLNYKKEKIDVIGDIIGTMSYSKIKKNGFPDLGEYQNEFNVVREADLLAAYDIDRAIIYNMTKSNNDFESAFINSKLLYYDRMAKHHDDQLFTFNYTKSEGNKLNELCMKKINDYNKILQ